LAYTVATAHSAKPASARMSGAQAAIRVNVDNGLRCIVPPQSPHLDVKGRSTRDARACRSRTPPGEVASALPVSRVAVDLPPLGLSPRPCDGPTPFLRNRPARRTKRPGGAWSESSKARCAITRKCLEPATCGFSYSTLGRTRQQPQQLYRVKLEERSLDSRAHHGRHRTLGIDRSV
jgi:hypothetical protein